MTDLTHSLREVIQKQLHQGNYDVIGVIPIPGHSDRMVRIRTLQEILEDFEESTDSGTLEYLIQIKPKRLQISTIPNEESIQPKTTSENIYLSNGKLNILYLMKNADLLFDSGDYILARNVYKTILRSGEYVSPALYRLGRCFEAEGKVEEAQASYQESITYHPTLDSYQRLASLLIRQNKDQQAAEVLERALNLKELEPPTRFELLKSSGNCWTRSQNTENAETNYKKALEINPSADDIRSNLGALYLQNNKILEAKRNFRDAIASNPKNFQSLAGLGSCALAEGDKKAGHDYFAQSLEIELKNPTAIFYLVKCAYEIKSYATAARILMEYVQIAPVNSNLLYSLAGLQFHLGRIEESKKTTLQILELHPQHAGAKELLTLVERYTHSSS